VNLNINDVPANLAQLPADKAAPIVVLCQSGHRGGIVMMYLQMLGYTNVRNLGRRSITSQRRISRSQVCSPRACRGLFFLRPIEFRKLCSTKCKGYSRVDSTASIPN
jgi:rhodanese-related sulfurtransferase